MGGVERSCVAEWRRGWASKIYAGYAAVRALRKDVEGVINERQGFTV